MERIGYPLTSAPDKNLAFPHKKTTFRWFFLAEKSEYYYGHFGFLYGFLVVSSIVLKGLTEMPNE